MASAAEEAQGKAYPDASRKEAFEAERRAFLS